MSEVRVPLPSSPSGWLGLLALAGMVVSALWWLDDAIELHDEHPVMHERLHVLEDAEREREILWSDAYRQKRAEAMAAQQLYERVRKGEARVEAVE